MGYSQDNKKISVVMRGSTTSIFPLSGLESCLLNNDIVTDILNDIDTTLVTPSFSGVSFPSGVKIMRESTVLGLLYMTM